MEETFSLSRDMIEYVSIYWSGESYFGEQDSSGDMDSYWRKWVSVVTEKCL